MTRVSILLAGRAIAVGFAACACGGAAHADVLEVDSGGAQWIVGPLSQASAASPQAAQPVPDDIVVPDEAVAGASDPGAMVPAAYSATVRELSARYDLSPALIEALVWQESRWHANAVSPKGAEGLAQLMPGTARAMGVDPRDPAANLEGGARYLREQLDRFGGDLEMALAAYNAGPGRVESAGGVPNIRETQAYVSAVMGRLSDHSRSSQ
jgi:soluble lytic murein transglycosylase-like protein